MNKSNNILLKGQASIVLCGQAGQGIQTIDHILSRILRRAGYNAFSTSEFMSRIRGGSNSTEIRVTSYATAAYVERMDIFIPLDNEAISHCEKRITESTLILGEKAGLTTPYTVVDMPFLKTAEDIGGKLYANSVAVGAIAGMFGVGFPVIEQFLRDNFSSKTKDIIEKNVLAARAGLALGTSLIASGLITIDIDRDPGTEKEYFMNGAEAIALGALAAGCDFVSSYPMSPSTTVLSFLAEHKNEFGIVVEQAEDEIAAINMALGAWYAGARALVTTAGGGFALMGEAVSLAGMLETPVVVHVGQRPGPATGLPTRTEQGDLDLVLYAGHGEFPRAVYAPGTLTQAIDVMRKAFDAADRYQIPAFVLTDQFFLDSYAGTPAFDLSAATAEKHVTPTVPTYKRYLLTDTGVSPRGIPGQGDGIVCVDSDEHTEQGYITEDLDLRTVMVDKRLKKGDLVARDSMPPVLVGAAAPKTLVVCWGSNFSCVKEAISLAGRDDIAMLHFSQVYPLHASTETILKSAKKVIVIENNATGQFANLLKKCFGIDVHEKILKYNGMPFAVEELARRISASA